MPEKALLFINGETPTDFPNPDDYAFIGCTDGAYAYLEKSEFPIEKIDFVSGDFDSIITTESVHDNIEVIYTPNQDETDFHKALNIIKEKGFETVDVYGASGGEMDHFLGNLTTLFRFKNSLKITCFDRYSTYCFIPNHFELNTTIHQMISLYPFPMAINTNTTGLEWNLEGQDLSMTSFISTRNKAVADKITISFEKGDIILFAHHIK